jgi:hypothetical protein
MSEDVTTKKRRVKVDVFAIGADKSYDGRLLGLIDDAEFNNLLTDRATQTKCKTRSTMTVKEIVENHQSLDGLRLMVVVSKINGDISPPTLFISERLHMVGYVKPNSSCGFSGESDSWLMVEEKLE